MILVLGLVLALAVAVPAPAAERSKPLPPEMADLDAETEDGEADASEDAEQPPPKPAKRPSAAPSETLLYLELSTDKPVQGCVFVVKAHNPPGGLNVSGTFAGRDIAWIPRAERALIGLVGVDLEQKPGEYPLVVTATTRSNQPVTDTVPLTVVKGNFRVQRLKVPPKMVDPDAASLARIDREQALTDKAYATVTDRQFEAPFRRPVPGKETAAFGGRRIFNGVPKSPHSGADLRGKVGQPIVCPAPGTVVLVGDHYFTGKTVILDHGAKLFTQYAHLSEIAVKPGQKVTPGQPLGRVGMTGRVTGPHLHWGARLSGAKVNPLDLTRFEL